MKKLLVTTLITGALAVSALAQGTVSLGLNSTTTARFIQFSTDGTTEVRVPTGSPAAVSPFGNLNVAVYYASAGTVSPFTPTTASLIPAAWTQSANLLRNLYAPGLNLATTFTLQSAAGSSQQQVFLAGWTGTFTSFNQALTAGTGLIGWTGSELSGGALSWLNGTGAPLGSPSVPPVTLVTGALGYNGLTLSAIPEPSTFALAGLGAAALMIFRRRK